LPKGASTDGVLLTRRDDDSMTFIQASGISMVYDAASGGTIDALSGVDIGIERGEFVSLIGPSGCGKSTLLHILGGMKRPTSGHVTIDGELFDRPRPDKAGFVFQDYTLFPWKNVLENTEVGLQFRGVDRATRREIARKHLKMVGLAGFASSYPSELSGGMQQRVAIARAMTLSPEVLLMDEPFGALDEQTRMALGEELAGILEEANTTTVFVTHSLSEAVYLADRVIVMSARPGKIKSTLQVDEAHPRESGFMTSVRFNDLRNELFALLHDEFVRAMQLELQQGSDG